jgi:glutamate dehydrogenase
MLFAARRLTERATRWLLHRRPRPLDISAEVERFAGGAAALAEALPELVAGEDREAWERRIEALCDEGVPAPLARRAAGLRDVFAALDIVVVAGATGTALPTVMSLHFAIGRRLHLHSLRDHIAALPRDDRWKAMARAALRDDLIGLHAELTGDIARTEGGLPAWLDAHRDAVERCISVLGDIRATGTYDLTTLPVALREIRNVLTSGQRRTSG